MNEVVVLYVDGEPLDVMYLRRAISNARLPVTLLTVSDAHFAIEWLKGTQPFADRKAYPVPDLIVTELKLPMLSGFELLRFARNDREFQNLPIVVYSNSQYASDAENSVRFGALSYFRKTQCCSALLDFMRGWLAMRLEDELDAERTGSVPERQRAISSPRLVRQGSIKRDTTTLPSHL